MVPCPWGQFLQKFRFIEKYGVQDMGCRHVAKRSADLRQAYPEVKLQGRDIVRVVGIIDHFAPLGAGTRGKNRFVEALVGNGCRRRVPGAPSSGKPRESQVNFRVGTIWAL